MGPGIRICVLGTATFQNYDFAAQTVELEFYHHCADGACGRLLCRRIPGLVPCCRNALDTRNHALCRLGGRIVGLREHNIAAAVRESRVSDLRAARYFVDAHAIEDRRKTSRDHLRMSPT